VTQKELHYALEQVTNPSNGSRDEAVHEARKCCKKVRALLRLVRPVVSEGCYRYENLAFRDAARPLSEVRDAKSLVETVDKVAQHFADRVRGQPFALIRKALLTHQREVRKRVLDEEHAFAAVETAVQAALERLDDWANVPNRWSSVGDGVQQVYRQARRAFADALEEPTVEKLHEWRKQAKYLAISWNCCARYGRDDGAACWPS
jgi:CHAD domain-containing protein